MTINRFENGPRMSRVVVHGDTVYLAGLTAEKTVGASVADLTFLPALLRVLRRNVKSKATLES